MKTERKLGWEMDHTLEYRLFFMDNSDHERYFLWNGSLTIEGKPADMTCYSLEKIYNKM